MTSTEKQWREGRKDYSASQKRSLIYERKADGKGKPDPEDLLY